MSNIIETADGSHSIKSDIFDVTYHSIHGAINETKTVFIDAALLPKANSISEINILEIGFGTGLNALMTYQFAFLNKKKINYHTYEAYPIDLDTANKLNYLELLKFKEAKPIFQKMHEENIAIFNNFTFHKYLEKFQTISFQDKFDIIYYDAFAPNAQPELWEEDILKKMYNALTEQGILTTYCAQGAFKRNLKNVGFTVEALPGPTGKREMTRAMKTTI